MLSEEDMQFLNKRAALSRRWPIVGTILLISVALFTAWLWYTSPRLINPWLVFEEIEAGLLPESMTMLMAAMLPIAILSLLGLVALTILLLFVAFANERRLVETAQRLLKLKAGR